MKCYRLYVNNEVVGTHFSLGQAIAQMNLYFDNGYASEDCEIKIEQI